MLSGTPGRMLARFGSPYTLWCRTQAAAANAWDAGAFTDTFYPCVARDRAPKPMAVAGTVVETERIAVIDAASIAVVPKVGDRLAVGSHATNAPGIAWMQITDVDIPFVAGAAQSYRCKVSA